MLWDNWASLVQWYDSLSPRQAGLATAVALMLIGSFGKYVAVPLLSWTFRKTKQFLDPFISGAVLFDRFWARPRYLNRAEAALERVRNPWLPEGKRLRELFIPVHVRSGEVGGSQEMDLRQTLSSYRAAIVIGGPGSGKTTGLRAVGLAEIDRFRRSRGSQGRLPVFINLRSLGQSGLSFREYLAKHFTDHGFPRPERFLRKQIKRGGLLFLLDGLDEVDSDKFDTVLAEVRRSIEKDVLYSNCRAYISSRPGVYDGQLHDILNKTLYMAEFTPRQIRSFVTGFEFQPPKSAGYLISVITDRPPILEICRNPLMLTIAAYLYRETHYQLPESREEFYKICVDALLRRWDAAKELEERNRYTAALKEAFLEQLATQTLDSHRLDLSMQHLYAAAEGFLAMRKGTFEVEVFVEEIIRSGLLLRLPTGEAFFAHKTLAESLTAMYLRNRTEDLVARWEEDPQWWLEVVSLYIADPRSPEHDIALLLSTAAKGRVMDAETILAGEAHTCPPERKEDLLTRLSVDSSQWEQLSRRAFASLGRLGEDTGPLLLRMLKEGSPPVKQGAVVALGNVGKQWATQLIIGTLDDDATSTVAIDALASMGDRALSVVKEAVERENLAPHVLVSLVRVLDKIGSRDAYRLLIPFIVHESPTVRNAATRAAANHITDDDGSTEFDAAAAEVRLPSGVDIAEIRKWALPFHRNVPEPKQIVYAQLIANLGRELQESPAKRIWPQGFGRVSVLLAGPAAIYAGQPSLLLDRYGGSYELNSLSPADAKSHWTKLADYSPRKFVLDGEPFVVLAVFSAIIVFLPFFTALATGLVSTRLLISGILVLLFALAVAIAIAVERGTQLEIAPFCAFFGLFPAAAKNLAKANDLSSILLSLAILIPSASIVVAGWAISLPRLNRTFLFCLFPWLLSLPFLTDLRRLTFTTEENPFWLLLPRSLTIRNPQ